MPRGESGVKRLHGERLCADRLGDIGETQVVLSGMAPQEGELLLHVETGILGHHPFGLVDDDAGDAEDHVLEALEEHHIVKWVASELDGMKPDAERFRAKMTVLIESVRHHVEEEERVLFPQVRAAMGRKALGDIGDALEKAKKAAPTRPHPKAPDTPSANLAAGAAALVDKARDATRKRVRS